MTLYPLNDGIGSVALVQHVGSDKMIVNAARVSFGNDNDLPLTERDEKLIRYLLEHKHGTPFEHNLLTFKVVCPIFIDRHFVKHRAGVSKNETSARYTEVKEQVYVPTEFRQQAKNNRQASVEAEGLNQEDAHMLYRLAWEKAYWTYQTLLSIGVAREQARGVLPLALYTESYYTFNLRSLFHLLTLRDHEGAQWEDQQYARALAELAEPLFPATFAAWRSLGGNK